MWFKTCRNHFSKQYKVYCIRLMGQIKTNSEVAQTLYPPSLSGVESMPCLFWNSFRGHSTVAGSQNSEVCLHNAYKLSLKGYRWQLHHLCHECAVSYIWSLHSVRKSNSARKKLSKPIKGFLFTMVLKYIYSSTC